MGIKMKGRREPPTPGRARYLPPPTLAPDEESRLLKIRKLELEIELLKQHVKEE